MTTIQEDFLIDFLNQFCEAGETVTVWFCPQLQRVEELQKLNFKTYQFKLRQLSFVPVWCQMGHMDENHRYLSFKLKETVPRTVIAELTKYHKIRSRWTTFPYDNFFLLGEHREECSFDDPEHHMDGPYG